MIEAVLFDMGYTLLAPHPSFEELAARTACAHGVEVTASQIRDVEPHAWIEANERATERHFTLDDRHSQTFWTLFYDVMFREIGLPYPATLPEKLVETFTTIANYQFYPDVMPALERMRGMGLRLGVVSNWETWLHDLLAEHEIHAYFQTIVISGQVGMEKPDPEIFRVAMKALDVEPAQCVYVGDSVEMDVKPSLALGLRPFLIDRKGRPEPPDLQCRRITSLTELLEDGVLR